MKDETIFHNIYCLRDRDCGTTFIIYHVLKDKQYSSSTIRPHRPYYVLRSIVTDRVAWSVGLSVGLSH